MNNITYGFVASSFDLFHAGHVIMLKDAKEHCDHLLVALQSDPTIDRPDGKNQPIQGLYERYVQVSSCKFVDTVLVYSTEDDLLNLLKTQPINVRFLGSDYAGQDYTGKYYCEQVDIKIIYLNRFHDYSSTKLRQQILQSSK